MHQVGTNALRYIGQIEALRKGGNRIEIGLIRFEEEVRIDDFVRESGPDLTKRTIR
jgi:hypothetical protein